MDSGTAGSKQERCDDISNEMKSMHVDQDPGHTTSGSSWSDEVLAEQRHSSSRECKYSHIPMTVNQELLLDTKRVQRQCSEVTLTLFGRPPSNNHKRVGALL